MIILAEAKVDGGVNGLVGSRGVEQNRERFRFLSHAGEEINLLLAKAFVLHHFEGVAQLIVGRSAQELSEFGTVVVRSPTGYKQN